MIFPAIDLMDGGCVRLLKGDFQQRTNYEISPIEVARQCSKAGAEWMHIVDLDGAKHGNTSQAELIMEIAKQSDLKIQTGGGLRELYHLKRLLEGGVSRVVIGSLAVTNPQMVKFWISELGVEQIVVALDVKRGEDDEYYPATKGWTETSTKTIWNILDDYVGSGLKTVLVTDISKDGVLGGSNVSLYKKIKKTYPNLDLITSGGVGTLKHVKALKALKPHGIIIGKALYENKFTLTEAIAC